MKEEIFGPILPVITFNHFSEVIQTINSLDKPLVIYYYSKKHTGENIKLLEEQTSSGALICNESILQIMNADMPFGGVGMSGYGRYHGIEGFKQFSNTKGVMQKQSLNVFPFNTAYPPYNTFSKKSLIRGFQKMRGFEPGNPIRTMIYAPF